MPKHSILERNQLTQRLSRNAFDLSYRRLFTGDVGELLPIYLEHTNPNEHWKINPQVFLRAQTLNTAAFTRMKQNVDFFFVPYRLLCRYLPQSLVGTNYEVSTQYLDSGQESHMYLPLFHVGNQVSNVSATAQQNIPINLIANSFFNNPNSLSLTSDYAPNPFVNSYDDFGFKRSYKCGRLAQLLGYGADKNNVASIAESPAGLYSASALNFYAYNKVYMDFFRNPYLEAYDSRICNFDNLYQMVSDTTTDSLYESGSKKSKYINMLNMMNIKFFDIKYKNYKLDYFTHQNPIFRGVDFMTANNFAAPEFPYGTYFNGDNSRYGRFYNHIDGNPNVANSTKNGNTLMQAILNATTSGSSQQYQLSIPNLRSAYALDKLLAVSAAAKDGSYNQQILAHFGFDPKLDDTKCRFIGSSDAPVTISDVEATATTDQSTLAQIAGRGVSLSNGSFEFDTNEHGVIIGIFYITPECDYPDLGIDPMSLKLERSQFFQPEFDSLGQQPTTLAELNAGFNISNFEQDTGSILVSSQNYNSVVFGYNNRYAEYKSRVDKIDGEFLDDLSAWVTPKTQVGQSQGATYVVNGSWNTSISLQFCKISPYSVNNIFAVQADGIHNQFMCSAQFNVQAVRPMSVFGDPYSSI